MPYDRNIPYNDLPFLPLSKEVEEDISILKKLVTASRALASVNASVLRLPNPTMLVNTIALQEAKSSTAIENIFTTEDLIRQIITQMEATLEHGKSKIKWYSKEINELIFSQPYLKSKTLGELMRVRSKTTLTKYFSELAEAKILFPKKDGKEVYYINEALVRILAD